MRQKDTTNPIAHQRIRVVLKESGSNRTFGLATGFRIHLCGLYDAAVGPEWSSDGRYEGDYLHHIDLVFSGRRQVVYGSHSLNLEPGMAYFLPGNTPLRLHACVETWLAAILPPMEALLNRHIERHARFAHVFSLAEERLGADLRISTLAQAYGTSLHAFSMAFSDSLRMTPKEYLNRRLNQEAVQLVVGTELNIKEIAYRLRFSDEFYFSRFFNKMNGLSPARYRSLFRAEKSASGRLNKKNLPQPLR